MQSAAKKFEFIFTRYVMGLSVLALAFAVGMFAYLGRFSRYMADDYCEAVRVRSSSPIDATIERYLAGAHRAADRYSNILFVGFSELLGNGNLQITIVSLVILWGLGLVWCVHEIRMCLKVIWPVACDFFLGMSLAFFGLLLAPNLFQTVYWRSSMMTHFAPLVWGTFLLGFLMWQARYSQSASIALPVYPVVLIAAFIIAGFSEPPAATMVTGLLLILAMLWFRGRTVHNHHQLVLFACALTGALAGLVVMFISPAVTQVTETRGVNILSILGKSFHYSYLFVIDSLKTAPLPLFISAFLPLALVWLQRQVGVVTLPSWQRRSIWLMIAVVPFLCLLLIAAGFAPSVYGQGYPIERMRFMARTFLIAALMLEGALLGWLLGEVYLEYADAAQWAVLVLLMGAAVVYPLRAAVNVYQSNGPVYRAYANQWDARDAEIQALTKQGATDITIEQLDTIYGVNEYKENPTDWINRCAAEFYGLKTIRAQ